MNERGRNESDISRYTDVEYSPEGYKTVYRWGDFLEIAGGHVYNAMDTIDLVSTGGEYEGFNPRYAYTCEFVGCSTLVDGIALFRPVSRDGEDLTQIAFPDLPYIAKISTGEGACEDAGPRFASVGEAKEWCYQYSLRELAGAEKKPDPAEAAAAAKRAAGSTGGDGAGNAGAIKL